MWAGSEPQPVPLAEAMSSYRGPWEGRVERHGLRRTARDDVVAWEFGDFLFHAELDDVTSTVKARRAGFADCLDSEDRFLELFDELAARRVVPPAA